MSTDELWRHDPDRIVAAVQTTARMLIDLRDTANEVADRYAREARAQGHDFDTRIDYARGSAAGYSVALATLAGAIGVPAPLLAADIPSTRIPPMARPVLPGELTDPDAESPLMSGKPVAHLTRKAETDG